MAKCQREEGEVRLALFSTQMSMNRFSLLLGFTVRCNPTMYKLYILFNLCFILRNVSALLLNCSLEIWKILNISATETLLGMMTTVPD